ncbi:MAG: carboxypeptidase-like regulatory domain-containing protein, partial [Flavitalea sp.]
MKQCYLLLMLLISLAGYTQEPGPVPDLTENDPGHFRPARLYGKVIEGKTNKGVEAVSVQVLVKIRDSVKNTFSDSVLAGMLTKPNGDFSFASLPLPETFSIRFSAVGFADILQDVILERKLEDGAGFEKDLGNI